jgi:hypothetical protein
MALWRVQERHWRAVRCRGCRCRPCSIARLCRACRPVCRAEGYWAAVLNLNTKCRRPIKLRTSARVDCLGLAQIGLPALPSVHRLRMDVLDGLNLLCQTVRRRPVGKLLHELDGVLGRHCVAFGKPTEDVPELASDILPSKGSLSRPAAALFIMPKRWVASLIAFS